jgi:hypothetical protein
VPLVVLVLAPSVLGCAKNKDDDDDRPRNAPTVAAPPTPAVVTADPTPLEPSPTPAQPPAGSAAPAAHPTGSSTAPRKGGPAPSGSPSSSPGAIPTQFVPDPLKPLVPKIPAKLPL